MVIPPSARPAFPQGGHPFLSMASPSSSLPSLPQHGHASSWLTLLTAAWCQRVNPQEVPTADCSPAEPEVKRRSWRHSWRRMEMSMEESGELHGEEFALSPPRLCFLPISSSPRLRRYSSLPCQCRVGVPAWAPPPEPSPPDRVCKLCKHISEPHSWALTSLGVLLCILGEISGRKNPWRAAGSSAGQRPASLQVPRRWRSTRFPAQK